MSLRTLTTEELLQRVWIGRDPLTSTDLEDELARRLRESTDEFAESADLRALAEDTEATAEELRKGLDLMTEWPKARELLDVLDDFDLDAPEMLRERLNRLRKFDDVMGDLLALANPHHPRNHGVNTYVP